MAITVKPVSEAEFKTAVLENTKPVLVDFWAPWCAPCRMLAPIVDELAQAYGEKIDVRKVNIDEEEALARAHEVLSIPMLALFKDGKLTQKLVGLRPYDEIADVLEQQL